MIMKYMSYYNRKYLKFRNLILHGYRILVEPIHIVYDIYGISKFNLSIDNKRTSNVVDQKLFIERIPNPPN